MVTILRPLGKRWAILSLTLKRDSMSWKDAPTKVTKGFYFSLKIMVVGVRSILYFLSIGGRGFLLTLTIYMSGNFLLLILKAAKR